MGDPLVELVEARECPGREQMLTGTLPLAHARKRDLGVWNGPLLEVPLRHVGGVRDLLGGGKIQSVEDRLELDGLAAQKVPAHQDGREVFGIECPSRDLELLVACLDQRIFLFLPSSAAAKCAQ
jgi:hypothetical protein